MFTIDIHNSGGSGPYGNSAFGRRATGCLEAAELAAHNPMPCAEIYRPGAEGKPNALLLGTMVHSLIEHELKGVDASLLRDAEFRDNTCRWLPPENACDEAKRIYQGWCEVRQDWGSGETVGIELRLEAALAPGVIVQAMIDHLVRDQDGVLCIEDFKTSGRAGDYYTSGRTRLQLHLYTCVAWALGYDVQRLRVRQIVKTKTIQENIYDGFDLPDPRREAWLLRYLQGALSREIQGEHGPRGWECDSCVWHKKMLCSL